MSVQGQRLNYNMKASLNCVIEKNKACEVWCMKLVHGKSSIFQVCKFINEESIFHT